MTECVFCGSGTSEEQSEAMYKYIKCPICGEYSIMDDLYDDYPEDDEKVKKYSFKVSSFIRECNLHSESVPKLISNCEKEDNISIFCIENIVKKYPSEIDERIDRIILNLASLAKGRIEKPINLDKNSLPLLYCSNYEDDSEFQYILKILLNMGIITGFQGLKNFSSFQATIQITYDGWTKIDDLRRIRNQSKIVFVAMRICPKYENKYAVIKNAIDSTKLDYEVIRVDKENHNDKICDRIIYNIKRSKIVVCDLEEQNQGVYFEAGFAKGLGKEVIWLCPKKDLDTTI